MPSTSPLQVYANRISPNGLSLYGHLTTMLSLTGLVLSPIGGPEGQEQERSSGSYLQEFRI